MENRTLKERLADSEWVKNWFDQAGFETIKEIERLENQLEKYKKYTKNMYCALTDCSEYFDNRADGEIIDNEWSGNEEIKLLAICEDALIPVDKDIKELLK